jgi:hypothetical protein
MTTRRSKLLPALLLLALLLLAGAASAGQARRGRKWGRRGGKGGPRQIARPKFSAPAQMPEPAPVPQGPTGFTLELAAQLAFDGQDAFTSCQAACLEALQAANEAVLTRLFKVWITNSAGRIH